MPYDHGKFVWFELITSDIEKAKAFYGEVMGWKIERMPMDGGRTYDLIRCGDKGIGGFMTPPTESIPPHWVAYASVADVDATAKKIIAAGGKALADPFEVSGVGRFQPMQDPQGGVFCTFKSADGDPEGAEGQGSWHWSELWAGDESAALTFYETVFGYSHKDMPMPQGTYHMLTQGEKMRGGIMKSPKPEVPTMWLQYVAVDDCDATVDRAKRHGAEIIAPAMDMEGVGRFAILKDSVGAVIGVIAPANRG